MGNSWIAGTWFAEFELIIRLGFRANVEVKPIDLSDWHRVIIGGTGWMFLIEVALRVSLTYLLLMLAMRLLGKRVAAQLSLFELSVVVTLAAAIGVPLQVPDRGMLPPVVIIAVVIALQRLLSAAGVAHRFVESQSRVTRRF